MQREKVKEEWNRMAEDETAYDVDKVVEELEALRKIEWKMAYRVSLPC